MGGRRRVEGLPTAGRGAVVRGGIRGRVEAYAAFSEDVKAWERVCGKELTPSPNVMEAEGGGC